MLDGPVVGNDVVDLTDPLISGHHRRERFVSRVCAAEERATVVTSADLWALFAAKEAAYKALTKLGHSPGFAHREILVAPDLRAVSWRGRDLLLSVEKAEHHVHAVAWSGRACRPVAMVARRPTLDSPADLETEGVAARALLCALVGAATGHAAGELEVVRDPVAGGWDGFGPPRVECRGTVVGVDVSLSHDGPFVAAAMILPAPSSQDRSL
jgi:phosphopantetheinyl transferase (holo-ACP synthase)